MTKALLIRMDRIGDLVLTLPVDQGLAATNVDWWIPPGLSFVSNNANPKRAAREVASRISFKDFFKLVREVRAKRYDFAAVFQGPWWVGLALILARVPIRIGVRSKLPSFFFFNRGIRQKRSTSDRSELEYNFQLLEEGLRLKSGQIPRSHLKLAAAFPQNSNLVPREYFVVHPGMGGSALNWPTENYVELIRALSLQKTVAITGTKADENYLAPLKANLEGVSRIVWLDGKLKGHELIGVLNHAAAVVAPSTGVLHLAASTGQPTVGIFSMIRVQRALRWGPKGPRASFVEAEDEAPDAMSKISVDQVLEKIRQLSAI